MAYEKPAPNETVYSHLKRLENYLRESAKDDKAQKRKVIKVEIADKLLKLANTKAVKSLLDYGE